MVKNKKIINLLVFLIIPAALLAAGLGMKPARGLPSHYQHQSIREQEVTIYGKGLYKHMSAEVGPQGIAQDYVTFLVAVPLLAIALFWANKNSLRGRFLLAGTLAYFLVTYLFYLMITMYNALFLLYVFLLSTSFFAFSLTLLSFEPKTLPKKFSPQTPTKSIGIFLIFNTLAVGGFWLSLVLPPLFNGSIIPPQVEHYTTLVVQGLDLALLLPLAFVAGWLLIKKCPWGYLLGTIYTVFLSLMMLVLTAKTIVMGLLYYSVVPVVFTTPIFWGLATLSSILLLKNIKE
jgi:hypothetical protein